MQRVKHFLIYHRRTVEIIGVILVVVLSMVLYCEETAHEKSGEYIYPRIQNYTQETPQEKKSTETPKETQTPSQVAKRVPTGEGECTIPEFGTFTGTEAECKKAWKEYRELLELRAEADRIEGIAKQTPSTYKYTPTYTTEIEIVTPTLPSTVQKTETPSYSSKDFNKSLEIKRDEKECKSISGASGVTGGDLSAYCK